MLVEEGFNMVSVDASDKMLKYALKARWERRKEMAFDQWGEKDFPLNKNYRSTFFGGMHIAHHCWWQSFGLRLF